MRFLKDPLVIVTFAVLVTLTAAVELYLLFTVRVATNFDILFVSISAFVTPLFILLFYSFVLKGRETDYTNALFKRWLVPFGVFLALTIVAFVFADALNLDDPTVFIWACALFSMALKMLMYAFLHIAYKICAPNTYAYN